MNSNPKAIRFIHSLSSSLRRSVILLPLLLALPPAALDPDLDRRTPLVALEYVTPKNLTRSSSRTSHIPLDTWRLTLDPSHPARRTSHIPPDTWHLTLNPSHPALRTSHIPPDTWHLTLDTSHQSQDSPPFSLPFPDPPGPDTWLLGQTYGNTTGAFRQRNSTYRAGQGVHFGVDLSARCGYPVLAIGDGVVSKVDALEHGSAPHNLMIDHLNGFASFYGHLLDTPNLAVGQRVAKGELVAYVGDPDETCTSRPHLHLEIRNAGMYNQAFNPIPMIDADWDTLALTGPFGRGFARDLGDPRRWQRLDDQPDIDFWGPILNEYANPWPPEWGQ